MTLRSRLLAITLATLILGILAIDFTTVTALRSFLISRVDSQLETTIGRAARSVIVQTTEGSQFGNLSLFSLPAGSYGEFVFSNGSSITTQFSGSTSPQSTSPPIVTQGTPGHQRVSIPLYVPTSIDSASGDLHYRVLAVSLPSLSGTMVLSIPLTDTLGTIHRLEIAEILVSLGVIIAMSLLGAFSIRLGLSPLERMRAGARAITAGDTSARVEESGPAEVRTLGGALNTMLERLQHALVDSQSSQQRLRQFIADVSHELRTPLTSIKGYAELYLNGGLDPEHDTALAMERIAAESTRMATLIEDLLLLARMDQNRPLALGPVDLSRLVDRAIIDAHAVEPDRHFTRRIQPNVLVLGDTNRLTQVISNLLANIRTHTSPDTEAIVTVERLPKDTTPPEGATSARQVADLFGDVDETIKLLEWSQIARLSVRDLGPGLEAAQRERVFERFYRSDESRSRARGGAGLGLALVAAIAHSHGGTAWVASLGTGRGTTFGIDLPFLELDTDDPVPTIEPEVTAPHRRWRRDVQTNT
ncbi:MAG: sensor histidine kinase [Ferrimicrobium sp.]